MLDTITATGTHVTPAGFTAGGAPPISRARLFTLGVMVVAATNLLVMALAALEAPVIAAGACALASLAGGAWLAVGRGRFDRRRLQLAGVFFVLVAGSGLLTLTTQTRALLGPMRSGANVARAPEDRRASGYRFLAANVRPDYGRPIRRDPHTPHCFIPTVMPLVGPEWRPGAPIHYWAVVDLFAPAETKSVSAGVRVVANRALYTATAGQAAARHGLVVAPNPVFVEPTDRPDRLRLGGWLLFGRFLLFSAGLWGAALLALAVPWAPAGPEPTATLTLRAAPGALGRLCATLAVAAGGLGAAQECLLLLEMRRLGSTGGGLHDMLPPLYLLGAGLLLWTARRDVTIDRDAGTITWRRGLFGRTWHAAT